MRFDHKAGDKLFVDFSGDRPSYVDRETGEIIEAELFVAVMGSSFCNGSFQSADSELDQGSCGRLRLLWRSPRLRGARPAEVGGQDLLQIRPGDQPCMRSASSFRISTRASTMVASQISGKSSLSRPVGVVMLTPSLKNRLGAKCAFFIICRWSWEQ